MTIWRMRTIPKATNTNSKCVNTYCFATETMVTRTRLRVTLYVHNMSCFLCVACNNVHQVNYKKLSALRYEILKIPEDTH